MSRRIEGRKLTPEEEAKKRELFEAMSPRAQARIMKKGYDYWDPFQEPRDPREMSPRAETSAILFKEFVNEAAPEEYSNEYIRGVWDLIVGLKEENPKYKGMYDFCVWLSKKEENEP